MSDKTRKKTEGWGNDNLPIGNTFINDGSFLEMFKKRMEEQKSPKESPNNPVGSAPKKVPESEQKSDQPAPADKPTESDSSTASGTKPIIQVVALCTLWVTFRELETYSRQCLLFRALWARERRS